MVRDVTAFVRWLLVASAAILLAGCGDGPAPASEQGPAPAGIPCQAPPSATPDAAPGAPAPFAIPLREGFEQPDASARLPFPPTVTDGAWTVQAAADAPEGSNVMSGRGDPEPGFSTMLFPRAGDLADLEFTVSFSIGCGEHPSGVGVVLHVQDADDYQIVRYSPSEGAWDFFTLRAGERTRRAEAQVDGTDPQPRAWVDLRVTSVDGRVQAFDGEALVLDFTLGAADANSGQVGLFLRGDSEARFDAVAVGPPSLPA